MSETVYLYYIYIIHIIYIYIVLVICVKGTFRQNMEKKSQYL